jgi:uncharacterized membrane protein YdbT with pleckstrin-like domain
VNLYSSLHSLNNLPNKVIATYSTSRKAFRHYYAFAIITFPTIILPILSIVFAEARVRCFTYRLTENHLVREFSLLQSKKTSLSLSDIESISVTKGFFETETGTVTVTSIPLVSEITIEGVENPEQVKDEIQTQINK